MEIKEIVKIFRVKQYMLNMGAGKLAKQFKVNKEDIYKAKEITREALETKRNIELAKNYRLPRILILDIETAPLLAYIWRRWNQNIYVGEQLLSEWFMLTWSAKWLFEKDILNAKLTSKEALVQDDSRIVKELWELLDQADIVIAHNAEKFDIPHINARFLTHSLPPPAHYKTIDTLKTAKTEFNFSSYKIDELAKFFGFEGKLNTGFGLWKACMQGDSEALTEMSVYNDQDVILLEEVYLKLRPWIKNHPNVGLYMELDIPVCKNCGNTHLTYMDKYYYTQTGKFETYRCNGCGAIGRRRLNAFDKTKKENLLV